MATPRRYPLIFNPKARSQRGQRALRFFKEKADHFTLQETHHADAGRELAASLAAAGEPVVVAAGGDGTLNTVIQGLAGTDTALGVMPTGTMNVFARELGIPVEPLSAAFAVIERGFVREVDLFEANGTPFLQMAGVGFDAKVIEDTTWESKKAWGALAYLMTAVKVLGQRPPRLEVICADGRREEGVAVLVGNGALYGGQFKMFRKATNTDGLLDILVYKDTGYRLVLDSLRGLASGGVDLVSSTCYLQSADFVVRAAEPVPVQVDGELLGRFAEVRFAPAAKPLQVIAPEHPRVMSAWSALCGWCRAWSRWPGKAEDVAATHAADGAVKRPLRRWFGRLMRVVLWLALVGVGVVAYANFSAVWASRGRLFDDVKAMPKSRVGLVFGTTDRINGRENLYFRYRIEAAAKIWRAGKVDTIIVSGDNRVRDYNEPKKMRQALIEQGIPADRIVCDQAGLRTLDSVVRAKEIFGATSVVFISQRFQNERALYLADANGMDAYGFNAQDVETHAGFKTKAREVGARVLMWLDVNVLHTRPKHLGEPIKLPD